MISICECSSKILEISDIFKGCIGYPYFMTLSCILLKRYEHGLLSVVIPRPEITKLLSANHQWSVGFNQVVRGTDRITKKYETKLTKILK
jgi:hypothetical protein